MTTPKERVAPAGDRPPESDARARERRGRPAPGLCTRCDEPVEPVLLAVAPAPAVCLGCMSAAERDRLEEDLARAQAVSRGLLPRRARGDLDWGFDYRAHRILSGDFFDVRDTGHDGRTAVVIGDVAGHGLPASLLMASLQATLRSVGLDGSGPAAILARAHGVFVDLAGPRHFASVFYGEIDARADRLVYANGGHPPPVFLPAGGPARRLAPTGTVVGLVEGARFEERAVPFRSGDTLVLVTDGITEAGGLRGELFGIDRLAALVDGLGAAATAQVAAEAIAAEAERFAGGPAADDATVLVVRRR